jgi:hypothetical protein
LKPFRLVLASAVVVALALGATMADAKAVMAGGVTTTSPPRLS